MIPGRERRLVLTGCVVLLTLGLFVGLRLRVTSDITHFLPRGEADERVSLARELAAGELSRTKVLLIHAGSEAEALAVSRAFESGLRGDEDLMAELSFFEAGVPQGVEQALWSLYEPRRFAFGQHGSTALDDAALEAAARELKRQLASPMSGMVSRVAPRDPLLILPQLFDALSTTQGGQLRIAEDRFLTKDGEGAVFFLGSKAPAFDSSAQRPLLERLERHFQELQAAHGEHLRLRSSDASRFALAAEDSIRSDISRVTAGSIVGLLALFLWLFGSLRLVLLTLPVVSAGFLVGTSACLLIFGSIHGLTLAFGAALIGVSIDYTVHVQCHQVLAPHPAGARATLGKLWNGLSLGAATTVVGFVALLASSFPGMRELAVFSSTGIAAALFSTRVFLPGLLGAQTLPTRNTRRVASWIDALMTRLARPGLHTRALWLGLLVWVSLAAVGLTHVSWNDDLSQLNRLDPELMAEDAAVREQVVRLEQSRLVVAVGDSSQQALEANDLAHEALLAAQAAGELQSFSGVGLLLPSAAKQIASDQALRTDPSLWPRLREALQAQGFVTEAFSPFADSLAQVAGPPLRWDDLLATPMAALVRPYRVQLPERHAVLSFLAGVEHEAALGQRISALPGVHLIDIRGTLDSAYGSYRQGMLRLLLLGLVAVVLLVALRHRALYPTLSSCLPAFLAAAATVGLLSLLGVALNILSLVALLMVVSMGVDYGVFLAEAGDEQEALSATQLALFVSALSTLLGFGLLALSNHPSLFSIGSTAGLGILMCLFLAPLPRLLFPRTPAQPTAAQPAPRTEASP